MVNFLPAVMGQHVDLSGKGSAQLKQLAAERKFAELASMVDQVMPAREGAYVKAQAAHLQKQYDVVANELEKVGAESGKDWTPNEDRMIAMEAAAFGAPKTAASIKTLAERRALSEDLAVWETKMGVLAGLFAALTALLAALGAYEAARGRAYRAMLKDGGVPAEPVPTATRRSEPVRNASSARPAARVASSSDANTATADAVYMASLNNYATASLFATDDHHRSRSSGGGSDACYSSSYSSSSSDCGSSDGGCGGGD